MVKKKVTKARKNAREEKLAEKEKPKPKKKVEEDDFWTEELEDDMEVEEPEEVDSSKLTFTKIKELKYGMENINIEATIDFVGDIMRRGYGESPFALAFIKDETGEIKITFWGDDLKKAKPKKKVRIINCGIGEFRGQLQVYPDKTKVIEFP